ncbi:MAG TPA: tyrosine-type recombinase/integrase [Terriglobales bacterium]|nr:tyrosine-type recombinase/integrase [Terriglobales bacterium]
MSIYKRGGKYWYKFMWQAKLVRESTKQGNDKVARQMEAAHRTSLARGEVGLRDKEPAPTLADFAGKQFLPWAEATFAAKVKTVRWYRNSTRRLLEYSRMRDAQLSEINGELIAAYIAQRQARGLQITSINRELQVLRRMLRLAVEWGVMERTAKVRLLPGERHREFVLSSDEEARYLAAAPEPLASIAAVLADTGMRPDECFRLRWEFVTWVNGRHGILLVTYGKTAAARRVLPMTLRVRAILEARWEAAGGPLEGWVWPSATTSGHMESSSLKRQHGRALRLSGVRHFVLYSFRHTFLTRLGASGCDVWTLARIAGHSSIAISAHYVHPDEDVVMRAMDRLPSGHSNEAGHRTGHSNEAQDGDIGVNRSNTIGYGGHRKPCCWP